MIAVAAALHPATTLQPWGGCTPWCRDSDSSENRVRHTHDAHTRLLVKHSHLPLPVCAHYEQAITPGLRPLLPLGAAGSRGGSQFCVLEPCVLDIHSSHGFVLCPSPEMSSATLQTSPGGIAIRL